jgi:hypothetical protein
MIILSMQNVERLYNYYYNISLNISVTVLSKTNFLQNAVTERSDV